MFCVLAWGAKAKVMEFSCDHSYPHCSDCCFIQLLIYAHLYKFIYLSEATLYPLFRKPAFMHTEDFKKPCLKVSILKYIIHTIIYTWMWPLSLEAIDITIKLWTVQCNVSATTVLSHLCTAEQVWFHCWNYFDDWNLTENLHCFNQMFQHNPTWEKKLIISYASTVFHGPLMLIKIPC